MLTKADFIRHSLGLHLFFGRIMKEHALFLKVAFFPKNSELIRRAEELMRAFEEFLSRVVGIAGNNVSRTVLASGEVVTPFTLEAERATEYFTGTELDTAITERELDLSATDRILDPDRVEQEVKALNNSAITLISEIIEFKVAVLNALNECRAASNTYPLLVEHILREARLYLSLVQKLQDYKEIETNIIEEEIFWSRIMAEHSEFIRGLLDPTEDELIATANNFANQFEELMNLARTAQGSTAARSRVTRETVRATRRLREFKAAATEGLLNCEIKAVILPLLGDHVLREANHYLRLLGS